MKSVQFKTIWSKNDFLLIIAFFRAEVKNFSVRSRCRPFLLGAGAVVTGTSDRSRSRPKNGGSATLLKRKVYCRGYRGCEQWEQQLRMQHHSAKQEEQEFWRIFPPPRNSLVGGFFFTPSWLRHNWTTYGLKIDISQIHRHTVKAVVFFGVTLLELVF